MLNKKNSFYFRYLFAIAAIVGGYLFLLIFSRFSTNPESTLCPVKLVTGVPCPGCGMGRATLSLFSGDLLGSFHQNILNIPFTILVMASLVWLIIDLIKGRESFFPYMKKKLPAPYMVLLVLLLLTSWVVNIVRGI